MGKLFSNFMGFSISALMALIASSLLLTLSLGGLINTPYFIVGNAFYAVLLVTTFIYGYRALKDILNLRVREKEQ